MTLDTKLWTLNNQTWERKVKGIFRTKIYYQCVDLTIKFYILKFCLCLPYNWRRNPGIKTTGPKHIQNW